MQSKKQPPAVAQLGFLILLVVLAIPHTCRAAEPALFSDDDFKIPLWGKAVDVRGSIGYKDNVTLSDQNRQGSGFWDSGLDLVVYRLPTSGWLLNFLVSADDTRYFNAPSVHSEQFVMAGAKATYDFGNKLSSGFGANYIYQNQVLDLSAIETNTAAIGKVLGNNLNGHWFLRKDFSANWVEVQGDVTRQTLNNPLDSYWQFGPKVILGHTFSPASDLALSYQWYRLKFDTRLDADSSGILIPGDLLDLDVHVAELAWRQLWGAKRRWSTTVIAGYERSQDNGSGYFDYSQSRLAVRAEYNLGSWRFRGSVRGSRYYYPIQTISSTSSDLRHRFVVFATLRADKRLSKSVRLFADYTYDSSRSNLASDRYRANTVSLGIDWGF